MNKVLKAALLSLLFYIGSLVARIDVFAQSSPYYNCPVCGEDVCGACQGTSSYCGAQTNYQCAYTCTSCPQNPCTGYGTWGACDSAGNQARWCTSGPSGTDWWSIYQIRACAPEITPSPTGGGGGETTPTPTTTVEPTPSFRFQGGIYEDPAAIPLGTGGSTNLCQGVTTALNIVATTGTVGIARQGESKTQTLAQGIATYSMTTSSNNNDYRVALNLPFPPPDPENAWICACNADPSNPYRCLYTGQQPAQGNSQTHFFVKRANTSNTAWFQTLGGSSFALGDIESRVPFETCTPPLCRPALIASDPAGTVDSPGFALSETGSVITSASSGVFIHEQGARSNAAQGLALGVSVPKEDYAYFYAKFGEKAQPLVVANKPVQDSGLAVYLYDGNMIINEQNPWNVAADEQIIIFVNGSLNVQSQATNPAPRITTVASGDGFLMFIVKGNLTFSPTVGHTNVTINPAQPDAANVEGVFIADGLLTVRSFEDIGQATRDRKFIGAGTFVGWNGVVLQRDYEDSGNPELNNLAPTDVFIFRPDFIVNAPREIKSAQMTWRELEPSFSF